MPMNRSGNGCLEDAPFRGVGHRKVNANKIVSEATSSQQLAAARSHGPEANEHRERHGPDSGNKIKRHIGEGGDVTTC